MQSFSDVDLIPQIQRALKAAKYDKPTAIQAEAIPQALAGRDILGCAQTGTGKTAAFVLPVLNQLGSTRRRAERGLPLALILTPTRELAVQIADNIQKYGRFLKIRATLVYGGVSQVHQVRSLRRGTRIVVATPGRLLDLMQQGHLQLDQLDHFILDEADRMLDMGFLPDLEKIIADLPQQRQSLFFSATLAPKITELARTLLRDPVSINIAPEKRSLDEIDQLLQQVKTSDKINTLTEILSDPAVTRAIVFIRTKRNTSKVEKRLTDNGINDGSIHGDKSHNARQRTLTAFRRGKIQILCATDVAARGIDVDDVSHVINYDLPEDAETYVHRIGRTGRAGARGVAITFYTSAQIRDVKEIERYLGSDSQIDAEPKTKKGKTKRRTSRGQSENPSNRKRQQRGASTTRNGKPFKPSGRRSERSEKTFGRGKKASATKNNSKRKPTEFSWDEDIGRREPNKSEDKRGKSKNQSIKPAKRSKPKRQSKATSGTTKTTKIESGKSGKRTKTGIDSRPAKKRSKKSKKPRTTYQFTEEFLNQQKKKKKRSKPKKRSSKRK